MRFVLAVAFAMVFPATPGLAQEEEASAEETSPAAEFCEVVETAAAANDIPVSFFTRLLWQESRFRSDAVSPKGAQGIAQFMPGTAADRGLEDPFDPRQAIPASAHLLADLKAQFGNLGLAAAAYNAGADRVGRFVAGSSVLPLETIDYVLKITGLSADDWASGGTPPVDEDAPEDCLGLTAFLKVPGNALEAAQTAWGPWGVQVAGNFSRGKALSIWADLKRRYPSLLGSEEPMVISGRMRGRGTRPFYRVRVPADSRSEAEALCDRLRRAGGDCIVLKT